MKVNNFKRFLNEAVRDDEYSYLNDDLDKGRWDDSTYDPYDNEDEEDIDSDDLKHLQYLLRKMFTNSRIDNVDISGNANRIVISVYLNNKERLGNILRVVEVANKIRKDILPQYKSTVDIWMSKKWENILTFEFNYGDIEDYENW